ncbi:hypothetical protein [Victivallis sp. Marseille-Q1083]|uniref:hypothetical protein n=1 Tax=Victivallis sp. Marseille-Q1083 TaxID=2717288 RepID=UPI00158BBC0E|nr:hypothetical protein [Victivallis sp. Marseille-Q1083]
MRRQAENAGTRSVPAFLLVVEKIVLNGFGVIDNQRNEDDLVDNFPDRRTCRG